MALNGATKPNHKTLLGTVGIGLVALAAIGCGDTKVPDANLTPPLPTATDSKTTSMPAHHDTAIIKTNLGTIECSLDSSIAPKTVENFEKLANEKFYDGTKFHRVIPGFMIQGGDPNSKGTDRSKMGTGGPGYSIKAEFNDTHFTAGVLAMARSRDVDSAGSQFFITVGEASWLDRQYTAFGHVTEGMDVANKIVAVPRDENDNPKPGHEVVIESITIKPDTTK